MYDACFLCPDLLRPIGNRFFGQIDQIASDAVFPFAIYVTGRIDKFLTLFIGQFGELCTARLKSLDQGLIIGSGSLAGELNAIGTGINSSLV